MKKNVLQTYLIYVTLIPVISLNLWCILSAVFSIPHLNFFFNSQLLQLQKVWFFYCLKLAHGLFTAFWEGMLTESQSQNCTAPHILSHSPMNEGLLQIFPCIGSSLNVQNTWMSKSQVFTISSEWSLTSRIWEWWF